MRTGFLVPGMASGRVGVSLEDFRTRIMVKGLGMVIEDRLGGHRMRVGLRQEDYLHYILWSSKVPLRWDTVRMGVSSFGTEKVGPVLMLEEYLGFWWPARS